jgi:hypothetical protein
MKSNFRLVYCSRNRIAGTPDDVFSELQKILVVSRAKNFKDQVTGALLYNNGNFAQVLEGPLPAVESIFEKIQRDPRHSEVVVVQTGSFQERQFPEWSMAFAGTAGADRQPLAAAAFQAVSNNSLTAGTQILELLRELVVQEDDWILENAS